ncbi:hypothetical protein [Pelagibius sp.]|uniref:hypothetical protein n=1 Tax=Pelagibius sp. TaxID=1931238 RepID=UPI00260673E3|nr:hypothetical protein [Pelagibius sp.]
MHETYQPADPKDVVQSIAMALQLRVPQVLKVKDASDRERMARAIAVHLELCGYKICKRPWDLPSQSVLAGPKGETQR